MGPAPATGAVTISVPDESLDACVHRALRIAGEGATTGGSARGRASEARRLVFAMAIVALARSRGRIDSGVGLARGLAGYRLSTEPSGPAPGGTVLARVFATVRVAAEAASQEEVMVAYERSLKWSPAVAGGGEVVWDGGAQHAVGAFFTPPSVAAGLLAAALDPSLEAASMRGPEAILGLRVCDPACGAGAFLLTALRRMSEALARARSVPLASATSAVLRRCIFGVDIDPAAVELCRALAWLESALPWSELRLLESFRCGNSLLGTTPSLAGAGGVPGGPAPSISPEDAWCRKHVGGDTRSFFHWHLEFPDVFHGTRGPRGERTGAPGGFDAIVGNPPFLNQLEGESAHGKDVRGLLRARFAGAQGGYADTAVAFTLLGLELLREGGRCALIVPLSVLGARDAQSARAVWARCATLESIWLATEHVFEGAAVFVCAPTLLVGGARRSQVTRTRDLAFSPASAIAVEMDELARAPTWSPLVSDMLGVPRVPLPVSRTLGDEAGVTADFRDQYYGLRGFIVEADAVQDAGIGLFPRLVTTGLVDLALCRWGSRPTRFDGRRWLAPRVDLSRLERHGDLGPWARSRLVPKLILATQTRVLEVVVDEQGDWLPSVPLISVVPTDPDRIWHLAAALASPVLTATAAGMWLGTALTIDAIKLSASQVRALPLPPPGPAWNAAADRFRTAQTEPARRVEHILACGTLMCRAYGLEAIATDSLLAWWAPRAAP